jgi:hypothetical protein
MKSDRFADGAERNRELLTASRLLTFFASSDVALNVTLLSALPVGQQRDDNQEANDKCKHKQPVGSQKVPHHAPTFQKRYTNGLGQLLDERKINDLIDGVD